jgi:hypothetical protein
MAPRSLVRINQSFGKNYDFSCFTCRTPQNSLCIPVCIQQDATLHSLLYLETAVHVSGGTTTHHQKRKQLYLQHLVFVTPLLLPAAIVEEWEPV